MKNVLKSNVKKTGFAVTDKDGNTKRWYYLKDWSGWNLIDHENYYRWVGKTWTDAVPMIHMVASNHNFTCLLSTRS